MNLTSWTGGNNGGGFAYTRVLVDESGELLYNGDFGPVIVNSSDTLYLNLSNIGYEDLEIDPVDISGSVFTTSSSGSITLSPGTSENIPIIFSPAE